MRNAAGLGRALDGLARLASASSIKTRVQLADYTKTGLL